LIIIFIIGFFIYHSSTLQNRSEYQQTHIQNLCHFLLFKNHNLTTILHCRFWLIFKHYKRWNYFQTNLFL